MSYTEDLIDERFGVSGGSGILSDGTFYWRRDVAEYVREYGIDVGEAAVEHMRRLRWRMPDLPPDRIADIDEYLYGLASGR
ncbi:hypothetical protein ONA70_18020 [Micromonospora yasonensis]|uniref:hypothetical protein n=1 Tax=Micromonospora yasonensis TaxID=1128667 RepID=UPI002232574B|nr:hypothetical protein [Micromonospora yasonensis]MCW3842000.1 hypothetical protein [Micromonospora yasonensis]